MMTERIEGRLAFLMAELKITVAQTPAWNTLAEAIRTSAATHTQRMRGDGAKTLIQRPDAHEHFMTARLEQIKQIRDAWSALYQSLSDSQKNEADEIVLPLMGIGGPGMLGR